MTRSTRAVPNMLIGKTALGNANLVTRLPPAEMLWTTVEIPLLVRRNTGA